MPRNPILKQTEDCDLSLGRSILPGNLPEFKPGTSCEVNLSGITYPGITERSFREFHFKCPYSTQASTHFKRDTDLASPTYWDMVEVPSNELTDHSNTLGIMIREGRGSGIHGHLCVEDTCPHFLNTGQRYFYR